ncbi:uncharacterized protein G2W53_040670 [Senna tora]|uniref:Uncharacterized protein n=1 Tax=Senna tora TaxID=362788 RepID=A0A834W273_9FABA|nr:uncharacterized protein G2W53_040670 [Senna tora]
MKPRPGIHDPPSGKAGIGNNIAGIELLGPFGLVSGLARGVHMTRGATWCGALPGELGVVGGFRGDLGKETGSGRRVELVDESGGENGAMTEETKLDLLPGELM